MPDVLVAPLHDEINTWEWTAIIGGTETPVGIGDTLQNPVEGLKYKLTGLKPPLVSGAKRCSNTSEIVWNREKFPPQEPLFVEVHE